MSKLNFIGRVAVVTGAGTGLGRAYALLLASRGAKVVVNDLGGDKNGLGQSKQADVVVKEITNQGGIAVANYDSVIDGDKIIQTAMEHFGRIDILINNAGILRDRSFANTSDKDWDLVHDVHLKGTFKTTRAAWPIFKKQNYGRVVVTSSTSGTLGNFGQANYSAAKMGVVGLANTLAIEGAKYNIHCNVIVPTAASRMTEGLIQEELFRELKPEVIAPVVAYLCHESNQDNGIIIDSAVGWAAQVHYIRSPGAILRKSLTDEVTIEAVRDSWPKITDLSRGILFKKEQSRSRLLSAIEEQRNGNFHKYEESIFEFGPKNVALYALGIGASLHDPSDLKYLNENHKEFTTFPTFFVLQSVLRLNLLASAIPHAKFDLANLLHGEHYIEVFDHLPTSGSLQVKARVLDVLDKKSGALIITQAESRDEKGQLVARIQSGSFILGAGNFNGKSKPVDEVILTVPAPDRKPDASIQLKTAKDQAALYRLSGDMNPLHIDPEFAKRAGQQEPILHGLCTFGFSMRAVLKTYSNNDSKLFKAMKVRFTRPVIPGQTLQVDMWKNGNRIHFETSVIETGTKVITGAFVDLKSNVNVNVEPVKIYKSDAIFQMIADRVQSDPAKAKSVNGVFVYKITSDGKVVNEWTIDLKNGVVYKGPAKDVKVDITITISDEDMVDIAAGRLNGQQAFIKGKIKATGNIMMAQKLAPFLKAEPKL